MNGMFYGVGLGPGDPELVTRKALRILQTCSRIYTVAARGAEKSVSSGVVAALPGVSASVTELEFAMSGDFRERTLIARAHAVRIAAGLRAGESCAFCTIGDPMTYSTCSYLLRALREECPELRAEIVPGVNSWSALAAELQIPLAEDRSELRIVPGKENPVFPGNTTTVFLKNHHGRNELLAKVPGDAECFYGEKIGLSGERLSDDREEIRNLPGSYLSILAVKS